LSLLTAAALAVLCVPDLYGQDASPVPRTGKQLYEAACVACHATDGRGAPVTTVGFDIPLPDFTDCSFATREPDGDWMAVIHDGGPARAFDPMMPAFGEALNASEAELILGHVRSFCEDDAWPRGELNLPRPLVTEKAFPEDEAVLTVAADAEGPGALAQKLVYERRFGARNQIELVFPFSFKERVAGNWTGGVGDMAFAVKRDMFHSLRSGSIFSLTGEIALPTGNHDRGFGNGFTVFEPFVTFGQILPAEGFIQMQSGVELPANRDRADEAFWRMALGKTVTQGGPYGRSWSPMVEVLASRELVTGEKTHWDLVPQLQVSLSTRQHILLNVGVRFPVNEAGTRTTQVMAYLLWDWFDGGLFSGW
jgi:hypothetical protein